MEYVQKAFDDNWVAPLGPNVDNFERDIEKYTECGHAAALSSGTAALHLALILADVQPDDYVMCQSLTFSASANPIAYLGAQPIFIDSEPFTWNMSPIHLEHAISDAIEGKVNIPGSSEYLPARKPKAIILVHLYGMPANLDALLKISHAYDIPLIEDAAESLGSTYKRRASGTFGKMSILSFNGNKIITTSGGGALLSEDEQLIQKARFLATQARDEYPHYEHSHIGYNYRMSNILAGIGRGQMQVLPMRVQKRREINQWYRSFLAEKAGVEFQTEPDADYFSNYWLTAITIDPNVAGISKEQLRLTMLDSNIEARPLWKPMHLQPVFKNSPYYGDITSEGLFRIGLCLPSGSNLDEHDKAHIQKTILKIFK